MKNESLAELRKQLVEAQEAYDMTPCRDEIALRFAKAKVTRLSNRIAVLEKLYATGMIQDGAGVPFRTKTSRISARR